VLGALLRWRLGKLQPVPFGALVGWLLLEPAKGVLRKFGVLLALGLLVVGRTEVVLLAGAVHRDALPSTERPMPQGHSTRIDEQRAGFSAQLVYQALDVNTS
jgi:hypothetical protein